MKDLDQLISKYPSLKYNDEKTKIVCSLTGHEMPPSLTAVKVYVEGKRYKKQLQRLSNQVAQIAANLSQEPANGQDTSSKVDEAKSRKWIDAIRAKYSEFLIPPKNPKRKNQLFCKLTLRHLTNTVPAIQQHITGHRFVKAYNHWLDCKETNQEWRPISKIARFQEEKEEDSEEREDDDEEIPDFLAMEQLANSDEEEEGPQKPEKVPEDEDNDIFPYKLIDENDSDDDEEVASELEEEPIKKQNGQKRKKPEAKKSAKSVPVKEANGSSIKKKKTKI